MDLSNVRTMDGDNAGLHPTELHPIDGDDDHADIADSHEWVGEDEGDEDQDEKEVDVPLEEEQLRPNDGVGGDDHDDGEALLAARTKELERFLVEPKEELVEPKAELVEPKVEVEFVEPKVEVDSVAMSSLMHVGRLRNHNG